MLPDSDFFCNQINVARDWVVFEYYDQYIPQVFRRAEPFDAGAPLEQMTSNVSPHRQPAVWRSNALLRMISWASSYGPAALHLLEMDGAGGDRWERIQHLPETINNFWSLSLDRAALRLGLAEEAAVHLVDLGSQTPVSLDGSNQLYPQVDADSVAWIDFRAASGGDVYVLNRSTSTLRNLTAGASPTIQKNALALDGVLAAWRQGTSGGGATVMAAELASGTIREIAALSGSPDCRCAGSFGCQPSASGGRVIWTRDAAGSRDICIYQNGGSTQQLTSGGNKTAKPEINGDQVVWVENTTNLVLHTIGGATTCLLGQGGCLASSSSAKYMPSYDAGMVVWKDGSDNRIWIAETANPAGARRLVDEYLSWEQYNPRVRGDWVVFLEADAFGNKIVRLHSISSGATRTLLQPLFDIQANQYEGPSTDGTTVVFANSPSASNVNFDVIWYRPPGR